MNNTLPRSAGILLHLSSMPSPFGIGVLGEESRAAAKAFADMGFSYLQMLPLGPVGQGDSPYASPSAFAGETLFLDPRLLAQDGLLTQAEVAAQTYPGSPFTTDYAFARRTNDTMLEKAFARADALTPVLEAFAAEHPRVAEYAFYRAVKETFQDKPWFDWGIFTSFTAASAQKERYAARTRFYLFGQYLFFRQYENFKRDVNALGIQIIGDMPMYVSMDSADVWAHPEQFCLDADYTPSAVAGVPPDYFSEDGQLWGNPLYDWKTAESQDFAWWRERISASLALYDVLRFDHFRAFASYWSIPAQAKTAKEGIWKPGPGMKLFSKVLADHPDAHFIAEDLGVFGEDVVQLLRDTGFPGMRIIQFGFSDEGDSTHLPHNCARNTVAFCGTHDNNTLLGWLWEASPADRDFALTYCGFHGTNWGEGGFTSASCRAIIEAVWRSPAWLAVIPFQDLCGFGSDARMNIPGVPTENWRFRTTAETISRADGDYYRTINRVFKRLP